MNQLRQLHTYNTNINFNEDCSGYLRNVACWSEFPACIDNGDKTWVNILLYSYSNFKQNLILNYINLNRQLLQFANNIALIIK